MILNFLNKQSHIIAKVRWYLFAAAATILILFVILMGLLRLALPYLTSYESEIETQLQSALNHPVSISRIDAGWHWFSPQLKLVNVNIYKSDHKSQLIHFDEVVFEFNVIDNLVNFRFEPSIVTLSGTHLKAERNKEGIFYIQGVALGKMDADKGDAAGIVNTLALLNGKELRLQNAQLQWSDKVHDSRIQFYKNINMSVQIDSPNYYLNIETEVPKNIGNKVQLIAEVALNESDWLSKIYIKAKDIKPQSLMRYIDVSGFSVSGKLNTELWFDLKNLKLQNIAGEFRVRNVKASTKKGAVRKVWASKSISSVFQVRRFNDEWDIVVDKLNMHLDNNKWEDVYFSLKYREDDNSLDARCDYLDLSDLGQLIKSLPLDDALIATLNSIDPKGELGKIELHVDNWKKPNNWLLKTSFNNLGITVPGEKIRLDGVSGELGIDNNNGQIKLESQGVVINSRFFNKPLLLSQLTAAIEIQKTKDGFIFVSDSILSKIDAVEIQSRIRYELGKDDFLDLQVNFDGADALWFNRHRTDELFGKGVAKWLSGAIVAGDFNKAGFMFRGLIKDFPFRGNEGVIQSVVDVEEGVLKYQPDWPAITNLDARFVLDNEEIVIGQASGRVNHSLITNSVTTINLAGDPHVVVLLDVNTNADDVNGFFIATPLKQDYLDLVKYVKIDGKLKTSLNIDIPLKSDQDVDVSGNVILNNNNLRVNDLGYKVKNINGLVGFKNELISSKDLTGIFNENKVTAILKTSKIRSGTKTFLDARLKSDVASLVPVGVNVKSLFNKKADWVLALDFNHSSVPSGELMAVDLKSDLSGLESNLPEPFSKKQNKHADFKLGFKVFDASSSLLVHYDDKLNLSMRWNDGFEKVRSDIRIMSGSLKALNDGVNITAKLKSLNAKEWQAIVLPLFESSKSGESPAVNMNLDFDVNLLQYGSYKLNKMRLKAKLRDDDWSLNVSSNELVGSIEISEYFNNEKPLVMNFKKLDLSSLLNFEESKGTQKNKTLLLSPEDVPPLKIQAKNFTYKDYSFSSMNLVTSRTSYGMTVHALDVKGENLSLKAKGNWFSKKDTTDNSNFRIEIESDDVGHMLSFYDFTESIEDGKGRAVVDWQWAASPLDFDWKLVSGRMQAEVEDGKFVDIEPGAGRLLGMFSLSALPSRFFLDFSDTFTEGFEFNNFTSQANFSQGHLYTSDTRITGHSANVYFRGRIGLADKDYDQVMSVIPRISSGVSGWIAVAQGAVVGLAAYLGQKLLGVDEAAKNQYHITGSWSDPLIKKMGKTAEESDENSSSEDE